MRSISAGAPATSPSPDVEQDQHGLLGQEPEAADGLRLVIVEPEVADRRAGLEALVDPLQHDLLALGRFALGRGAVPAAALQALEPALGHREVGEHELEIELLEVAGGIDAPGRVRVRRVVEGANDVEQRIRVAEPRQVVGRQLLGPDAALGRRRAAPAGRRR